MNEAARRMLDDLNEGDRIVVYLVDGQSIRGRYDSLLRDEDGIWSLVLVHNGKAYWEEHGYQPATLIDMVAIEDIHRLTRRKPT